MATPRFDFASPHRDTSEVSEKVFSRWVHHILDLAKFTGMRSGSLTQGLLDDGLVLWTLVSYLSGKSLPKINTRALTNRFNRGANLSTTLTFLKEKEGLKSLSVSAQDIFERKTKVILSLFQMLITKYHIPKPIKSPERDGITWLAHIGIKVQSLTELNAHHLNIVIRKLTPEQKSMSIQEAIDWSFTHLSIPKIVEAEEWNQDSFVNLVYLTYFRKKMELIPKHAKLITDPTIISSSTTREAHKRDLSDKKKDKKDVLDKSSSKRESKDSSKRESRETNERSTKRASRDTSGDVISKRDSRENSGDKLTKRDSIERKEQYIKRETSKELKDLKVKRENSGQKELHKLDHSDKKSSTLHPRKDSEKRESTDKISKRDSRETNEKSVKRDTEKKEPVDKISKRDSRESSSEKLTQKDSLERKDIRREQSDDKKERKDPHRHRDKKSREKNKKEPVIDEETSVPIIMTPQESATPKRAPTSKRQRVKSVGEPTAIVPTKSQQQPHPMDMPKLHLSRLSTSKSNNSTKHPLTPITDSPRNPADENFLYQQSMVCHTKLPDIKIEPFIDSLYINLPQNIFYHHDANSLSAKVLDPEGNLVEPPIIINEVLGLVTFKSTTTGRYTIQIYAFKEPIKEILYDVRKPKKKYYECVVASQNKYPIKEGCSMTITLARTGYPVEGELVRLNNGFWAIRFRPTEEGLYKCVILDETKKIILSQKEIEIKPTQTYSPKRRTNRAKSDGHERAPAIIPALKCKLSQGSQEVEQSFFQVPINREMGLFIKFHQGHSGGPFLLNITYQKDELEPLQLNFTTQDKLIFLFLNPASTWTTESLSAEMVVSARVTLHGIIEKFTNDSLSVFAIMFDGNWYSPCRFQVFHEGTPLFDHSQEITP